MKLDPKKVKVHPARKMKDVLDTWTVKKSEEAEKIVEIVGQHHVVVSQLSEVLK